MYGYERQVTLVIEHNLSLGSIRKTSMLLSVLQPNICPKITLYSIKLSCQSSSNPLHAYWVQLTSLSP